MNSRLISIVASCLCIGCVSATLIFNREDAETGESTRATIEINNASDGPGSSENNQRLAVLEAELSLVKQQLDHIKLTLDYLARSISKLDDA